MKKSYHGVTALLACLVLSCERKADDSAEGKTGGKPSSSVSSANHGKPTTQTPDVDPAIDHDPAKLKTEWGNAATIEGLSKREATLKAWIDRYARTNPSLAAELIYEMNPGQIRAKCLGHLLGKCSADDIVVLAARFTEKFDAAHVQRVSIGLGSRSDLTKESLRRISDTPPIQGGIQRAARKFLATRFTTPADFPDLERLIQPFPAEAEALADYSAQCFKARDLEAAWNDKTIPPGLLTAFAGRMVMRKYEESPASAARFIETIADETSKTRAAAFLLHKWMIFDSIEASDWVKNTPDSKTKASLARYLRDHSKAYGDAETAKKWSTEAERIEAAIAPNR